MSANPNKRHTKWC